MAKKTISGARAKRGQNSNGCNPKHNNRDYLPSNADPTRQHLNVFYAESTKSVSLEQIYEKLFQASYEEWLQKEHAKGRQKEAPEKYIDKVRLSGDKKRDQYEIIWQFGDMKNTGWKTNREDFMNARELLDDFAEHLLSLPYIAVVTPQKLADPNWKPPFEDGLIITNLSLHGDENTPQLHMDFIPYSSSKKRGQRIQNAYAAAFKGMGYEVIETHLTDPETGELQYKKDKNGDFVYDKDGNRIPIKVKTSFGSIDWIEEQKGWLQQEMEIRYGWEREYKGKNKFGDVSISEFVVEDNLRQIEELEIQQKKIKEDNEALYTRGKKLYDHIEGLTELKTLAEYQMQVVDNDKAIQTLEIGIQNAISEGVRNNVPFDAVRKMVCAFVEGVADFIEKLKIGISRVTLFEKVFPTQFRSGELERNGERQTTRLNDALSFEEKLSNAYSRSEKTDNGTSSKSEKEFFKIVGKF